MATRIEEALSTVVESFSIAEEARKPYEKQWDSYFRLSRAIVESRPRKWMTNYFVPYAPAILDIVTSRLSARRVRGGVIGKDTKSALKATRVDQYLKQQQEKVNIDTLVSQWAFDATRYGTAFLKVGWKREMAQHLARSSKMIQKIKNYFAGNGFQLTENDLLYDDVTLDLVDIYDLYFPPNWKDVETCRYRIHRSEMTKQELLTNPNFSKNVDKIKELKGSNQDIGETRRARLQATGMSAAQVNKLQSKLEDQMYEVLEYRGLFDVDGDGMEEETVITVVNRSFIVQFEENPYYLLKQPYIPLYYKRDPHFGYGISLFESIKDSQLMLNDIANQAGDMRKLTLQPLKKVRKSANLDLESLVIAPNLPILLDDPERDLIFERPPDFTGQLEFMSTNLRQIMQIAAGINDITIGVKDTGLNSDTLGATQIAEEQASLRLRVPILNMDIALKELGLKMLKLDQQFIDRTRPVKLTSTDGMPVWEELRPDTVSGNFDYEVEAMSTAPESQTALINRLVQAKQLFMGDPKWDETDLDRQIMIAMGLNPDKLAVGQGLDAVAQMKMMDPAQAEAFISQLPPEEQELMRRAMSQAGGMNATQGQPAVAPAPGTSPIGA